MNRTWSGSILAPSWGITILVGGMGNEVLTVVEGWPVLPVMMEVL